MLSGPDAFLLWDTYGFPLDLTQLMAEEAGLRVDGAGFEAAMEEAREKSRAAGKKAAVRGAGAGRFARADPDSLQPRLIATPGVARCPIPIHPSHLHPPNIPNPQLQPHPKPLHPTGRDPQV